MEYYENIRRGEIFFVELGREVDHIQAGRRPVVVVSNNTGNQFAPHVLVCPLTQVRKDLPTHVRLQTRKPSYVLCETILAIDKRRLEDYQGKATITEMKEIDKALKIALSLDVEERRNRHDTKRDYKTR